MRCFFHKWSKWSEPFVREYINKEKLIRDSTMFFNVKKENYEYTRRLQKRECLKCGKIEEEQL